jgi:pathogenesis-related protein 1
MKTVVWNACIANLAQVTANKCKFAHSSSTYRKNKCGFGYIGENLAYGSGTGYAPGSGGSTAMVNLWNAEKKYYTYSSNSCARGKVCGHYTQIVWSTSNNLGCGYKACSFGHFYVCNYGAGGNIVGRRPYAKAGKRSIEERQAACSPSCGLNAVCDPTDNTCDCADGYAGDGYNCTVSDPLFLNGFEAYDGVEDWALVQDDNTTSELVYAGDTPSVMNWIPSGKYVSKSKTVIGVTIKGDVDSNGWGLCSRVKDKSNMACFVYDTASKKFKVNVVLEGKEYTNDLGMNFDWPAIVPGDDAEQTPVAVSVAMQSNVFSLSVNGRPIGRPVIIPFFPFSGTAGLKSSGPVAYNTLFVTSQRRLILTLVGCLSADQFKAKLATILGINAALIKNVVVAGCNSTKRQDSSEITFTLEGEDFTSADQYADQLVDMVSTSDPALSTNGVQATSVAEAPAEAIPAEAASFSLEATIGTAAGIGAGAVAGIVIGAVAAAGLVAGGTVAAVKYREPIAAKFRQMTNRETAAPAEIEVEKGTSPPIKKKPKGATVDLYDFNADTITSITARSPPRQKA